jgi:uncharacterized protein (DUF302 family)
VPTRSESYVTNIQRHAGFDETVEAVISAFQAEGFGVLCRIDVSQTMRAKIGIDMPSYLILGMCNPELAHRALKAEPDVGVLLPCNVAVYQQGDVVNVTAQDPGAMVLVTANVDLGDVAAETSARIERAMRTLKG